MESVPTSKDFPPSFYRVTIKGLVVKNGKILLLKESPEISGKWELPGGGLDFGEDIHQALRREIEEETGIMVKSISPRPLYSWTWRYENKRKMDWFYSLVLGYQVELENFNFKTTKECEEMGFFSKEELETIDLNGQTNELKNYFDPKDFALI